ncbi:MAG: hypothetical protein CMJ83_16705 [Planctomycetes bacterium]|nr:hypothetical protein [Planctomycetota bacterium]
MSQPVSHRLTPWFADYGAHHTTRGNRRSHLIGIPVLMVAILGLLARLEVTAGADFATRLDAGRLLWIVATVWYLWLDWRLGLPFVLFGAGCYLGGWWLPVPALITMFVLGWIIQYLGHAIWEKRAPAFHQNLAHLLIGPLWVFAEVLGRAEVETSQPRNADAASDG